MNRKITTAFTVFILATASVLAGPIKQFMLNPNTVYTLKLSNDGTPTTVMFPSEIQGIADSNVVKTEKEAKKIGGYLLNFKDNNYYFNIRAIRTGQSGSLNIIYGKHAYIVRLIQVAPRKAYSSVTFASGDMSMGSMGGSGTRAKRVAPKLLISAIDKAKYYPLYLKNYPDSVANITYKHKNDLFRYKGFSVKVNAVYRFNDLDTLVFWIILKNTTNEPIEYNKQNISVRCGPNGKIYFSSLTDASGVMPPNSDTQVYFCITGSPDGGHNWISVDNKFVVLVSTKKNNKIVDGDRIAIEKKFLIQQTGTLSKALDAAKDPKEIEKIKEKFKDVQRQYEVLIKQEEGTKNEKGFSLNSIRKFIGA